jgi:hypothetical protein
VLPGITPYAAPDSRRPIHGAFGFDLAAQFDTFDSRVISTEGCGNWGCSYKVRPEKTIEGFSDYEVAVDRNGRIVTIKAWGVPQRFVEARKLQDSLAILYEGYFQTEESEELLGGEMTYFYIKDHETQTKRVISLDYWYQEGEGVGWVVQYTDRALAAENLETELNANKQRRRKEADNALGDIL